MLYVIHTARKRYGASEVSHRFSTSPTERDDYSSIDRPNDPKSGWEFTETVGEFTYVVGLYDGGDGYTYVPYLEASKHPSGEWLFLHTPAPAEENLDVRK